MPRSRKPARADPLGEALEELAGAALVLGRDLHVLAASPAATALLGFEIPAGASAPALLCGAAERRPLAEALAAGKPAEVVIPRPRRGEERLLRVRSVVLASGFLLLLSDAGEAAAPGPVQFHGMWTQDPAMKHMFRVIERVARSDETVLVRGETGSGKELVAQALHALSDRRAGPFRALNCAALPASLLESELFGHARGAFTGATRDRPGHVQLAHRGTLFLDEVAELPLELQAKLLRVIETRTVLPVGGRDAVPVDVRIVSATHRALRKEVEAGRFRADLMYRLRVIPIFIPPLRERPGDVALLCERYVESMNRAGRRRIEQIAPATRAILGAHDWPGNVRELRNVVAYAYAIGEGPVLSPGDLPPELQQPGAAGSTVVARRPEPAAADPEANRLLSVLERAGGNRERAAQILGISRVTLWRRLRELGLAPPRRRA